MNRTVVLILVALVLALGAAAGVKAAVDRKRPKGDDAQQLRRLLYEAERAAEAGDATGVARFISEDYKDSLGMSDTSVKYQIRDYIRRRPGMEISIPSNSVQIALSPDGRTGQVQFRVQVQSAGGRRAQGQGQPPSQGGGPELEMSLHVAKEPVHYYWVFPGQEWRVTSAEGYTGLEMPGF